ncbi:MAG TPA: 2Fe-2S iron-sulfur cluster binding domain-containing protein [Firmicutes bacterium]|nr:2Fe-2S iron-sulfur cluster binding domain-containing protein [Bacillota bacterium]
MNAKNTVIIDHKEVELNGEKNILELTRKLGIDIPTFCYHSELSLYGACRMCVVEVEGRGIVASCSTPPTPGMKILTNSPRVQRVRKTVLELLLANHDRECTTCEKNGNCKLQELANRFGIKRIRFGERDVKLPIDDSGTSIVRDPNKCILCGDCVRMCAEVQGIGILDFSNRGAKVVVTPAFNKNFSEVECVNCGQCSAVCPTGALVVKSETEKAWAAIHDPEKFVVAQVAPAVRVALGEEFGLPAGEIVTGKVVAALKRLGFDKVFDTCIGADLTIMEETTEFIERLQKGEKLPQFTSCCPAWIKYAEHNEPELLKNLSSCRSPQQMFGSLVKKYWAKELGKDPKDIYVISIMPCTAKKFEAARPEFTTEGAPDVDLVLTTQELARMIRETGLLFDQLDIESFDTPFGFTTGAGVIFGATGGVSEAVLRAAHELVTGEAVEEVNFEAVRGFAGLKEATVEINGTKIKVAVVHGLGNAKKLLQDLKAGKADYQIIEVMACPGGCIGGAGQPISTDPEVKKERARGIYNADKLSQLRKSQDNPIVAKFYEKWLQKPNSHEAHEALHTNYSPRGRILGEDIQLLSSRRKHKVDVAVCVGTCCYLKGSYDTLKRFMEKAEEEGIKHRLNLHATFCLEGCETGPSVRINGEVVSGVTPDKADQVFAEIVEKLPENHRD